MRYYATMCMCTIEKQGVGRKEFVLESREQDQQLKANQLFDFKERQRLLHTVRQVQLDLSKSQTACEHLDTTAVSGTLYCVCMYYMYIGYRRACVLLVLEVNC